jgi:D-psicose/D-tagatose/L-ribulose 3-epimerase
MFEGTPEHFAWLGGRIADAGLAATAVGVMAGGNLVSADPAQRRGGAAHLDWLVDCATALGAEVLAGPFHQPLGEFTGKGPSEDELGRMADAHRAMADRAPGLTFSVEPLNRFECYVLNTAAQAAAHVARVDRPNFGYLYDTFHANIEERDPVGVIGETIGAISHIHISENDRGAPGLGHIDHAAAIRAARDAGYDGWFVVESFGQALPDLAAATRVWRPLHASPQEVVDAGVQVIRSGWDS